MDLWKSKENCVASSKDKESSSHIVHPSVTVNFEFYFLGKLHGTLPILTIASLNLKLP